MSAFADERHDTESVSIRVETVEQGCVEVHTVIGAVQSVANPETLSAIIDCIKNLVDFIRFLKGKPAKKVERSSEGHAFNITASDNAKIIVNANVYKVYGELNQPPLGDARRYEQDKITSVQLLDEDGNEKIKIGQEDYKYFHKKKPSVKDEDVKDEYQTLELVVETIPIGSPKKLWGFVIAGESVRAKIKDRSFLAQIECHDVSFAKGDRLVAEVLLHKEYDPLLNCIVVKSRTIQRVIRFLKVSEM